MASIILISLVRYFISPEGSFPTTLLDKIWAWSSLLWLSALLPGTIGLLGALSYRHPTTLDDVQPINRTICWRIVTAGKNINVVLSTIRRCQNEMAKTPLAPYIIEVVMDYGDNICLLPANDKDVRVIVVPKDYRPPNNSRFKARALHYALLHSSVSDATWIVHLDEETQPTSSSIKGICKFIRQQEISQELHIGQGGLLYHREWKKHPFFTLADNVRTGDDFARFYFQHRLGVTIFGLHGSFIVIRNDVEKATGGFDFGPHGDITEDAFWAVKGMENGLRCAWVEGYLEEQSCMSLLDFLRQRRRWFQGLIKVSLHAPVKLRWRFCLGLNTMLWGLAPFATLYTFGHLFYNVEIDPVISFLASYSLATFATLYLTGLKANMDEHGITRWRTRTLLTLLQIMLLPVFSTMESLGVLWAIFTPVRGFQVVKK
jgi:egghead protein (zeste-white 4 protein)